MEFALFQVLIKYSLFKDEGNTMRELLGKIYHFFSQVHKEKQSLLKIEALLDRSEMYPNSENFLELQEVANRFKALKYKVLALQYRLEKENSREVQIPLFNQLKSMVFQWKCQNPLVRSKSLTEQEMRELQTASQYPEFVGLLNEDANIQEKFLLWVIRDKNQAEIFLQFPALCEKLTKCNLSGRIGRVNSGHLQITSELKENGMVEKQVKLPFEGVFVNILNEEQVVNFKGGYNLSIKEIFEIFEKKNSEVGNLEYFAQGITNWNCHHWGHWDDVTKSYSTIDLNHHQWWKQLPILEVVEVSELQQRYQKPIQSNKWYVASTATRGTASLDFMQTHAFIEIAIPWGEGQFAIYDFGKFATKFPSNDYEAITMLCKNLHATVAYPDENIFYSHREQTYLAFSIEKKGVEELLEGIRKDWIRGKDQNFVYQIESDNCAKWVHTHLEAVLGKERVPDMFLMPLLETEPVGVVAKIFGWINKLPKFVQVTVLTLAHLPLGAARKTWIIEEGKVSCKSLTRHEFWETGVVYLPALLHLKLEKKAFFQVAKAAQKRMRSTFHKIKSLFLELLFFSFQSDCVEIVVTSNENSSYKRE